MRWAFVAIVLLWASPVGAQNRYRKLCEKGKPTHCAQAVLRGEPVPFDGQMYTTAKAIDQSHKAGNCDAYLGKAVDYVTERCEEKINIQLTLRNIEATGFQQQYKSLMNDNEALRLRLKEAQDIPFFREPVVVSVIAVILTIGVFWGTAEMQQAVAK